uniref:Astacin domain-containing protein n=1 Tax=Macrostomum lignano TaxID=282301 RepID=A0A1I8F686_9PLAT
AMSRVSAETGNCARSGKWQPSDGVEFVLIRSRGSGCSATVGYWAGRSTSMNLAERCTVGNIMHELPAFLRRGASTEPPGQGDQYVKIQFDNVIPEYFLNFVKESSRYYDTFNQPYDFGSQMHYSLSAFSSNGQNTIEPLPGRLPDGVEVGQRERMSQGDVALLKATVPMQSLMPVTRLILMRY